LPALPCAGFFSCLTASRLVSAYIRSPLMTVTVLLFASYADALGTSAIELDLPGGSTVRDVLGTLASMPGGHRLPPRPLVAINEQYATLQSELRGGEEVAVIPPVAGG
jgi:molybdopterin converting factor small subunit